MSTLDAAIAAAHQEAADARARIRAHFAPFVVAAFDCEEPPDEADQLLAHLDEDQAPRRRASTVPPAPVLEELPRITAGRFKGQRACTVRQYAGLKQVSPATVYDWKYTGRIEVLKLGTSKQARVRIPHAVELKDPVARRRGGA